MKLDGVFIQISEPEIFIEEKVESRRGLEKAFIKSPSTNLHLKNEFLDKYRKVATYTRLSEIIKEEEEDEDIDLPTDELEDFEYINVPVFPKIKNMFFYSGRFSARSDIIPSSNSKKKSFRIIESIRSKSKSKSKREFDSDIVNSVKI